MRSKRWTSCWRWLVALGLWLAAAWAHAQIGGQLVLDPTQQPVPLGSAGMAWIDPSGHTSADDVAGGTGITWTPTADGRIYALDGHSALWVRFRAPATPVGERWYLEVPYASVDRVTLYRGTDRGTWQPETAGDTLPVARWPVPHRHPLLPLRVGGDAAGHEYLLEVRNAHSFSAPLQFVTESRFARDEQRAALILGLYFGLASLAAVLAAVAAATLRDLPYALYAISITLMGLTQAAITGLAGLHLWPHSPWWNDAASLVLPVLAAGAMLLFMSSVVSLRQRSMLLHGALLTVAGLSLPVALGVALVEPSQRIVLMAPYIVAAATTAIANLAWATFRGDRHAPWVLAGAMPVAIGAGFTLARTTGVIPVSFWTMHGMQIGIALEIPILLVVLMARSQQRREHARRLQGLDRIDPATGLLSATVFHERLARLITRSQRLKIRSAVLLVDVVNMAQIERTFGRPSAQELGLRVAGRLLSVARDIDSVARLGEHRFGLLLEGPLKADEVAEAGPRVVARCLMPFRTRPLDWCAQVHVAQGLVPMDGLDAAELVDRLDALLAEAPGDSRPTVRMLSRPPAPANRAPVAAPPPPTD